MVYSHIDVSLGCVSFTGFANVCVKLIAFDSILDSVSISTTAGSIGESVRRLLVMGRFGPLKSSLPFSKSTRSQVNCSSAPLRAPVTSAR